MSEGGGPLTAGKECGPFDRRSVDGPPSPIGPPSVSISLSERLRLSEFLKLRTGKTKFLKAWGASDAA